MRWDLLGLLTGFSEGEQKACKSFSMVQQAEHPRSAVYIRYGTYFGSSSVQVNLATPNPDTQGVFAATDSKGKLSLVVVNKNPDVPIAFDLAGVPTGKYFIRHFGGGAGVSKWQVWIFVFLVALANNFVVLIQCQQTTTTLSETDYITVPAYTALFIQQQ